MTNEEILKKAIEKAIKNGWIIETSMVRYCGFDKSGYKELFIVTEDDTDYYCDRYALIFSHDFAKAFWPTKRGTLVLKGTDQNDHVITDVIDYKDTWQYHLQQIVLEENPILYLEKFL